MAKSFWVAETFLDGEDTFSDGVFLGGGFFLGGDDILSDRVCLDGGKILGGGDILSDGVSLGGVDIYVAKSFWVAGKFFLAMTF